VDPLGSHDDGPILGEPDATVIDSALVVDAAELDAQGFKR
jgi:hypothetical protein